MRKGATIYRNDHFDGRRFFNPTGPALQPFTAVPKLLVSMRRTPWPARIEQPAVEVPTPGPGQIVMTSIGHATFLIQTPSGNVLTDPVYSERAGPRFLVGLGVFDARRLPSTRCRRSRWSCSATTTTITVISRRYAPWRAVSTRSW